MLCLCDVGNRFSTEPLETYIYKWVLHVVNCPVTDRNAGINLLKPSVSPWGGSSATVYFILQKAVFKIAQSDFSEQYFSFLNTLLQSESYIPPLS